jgi:hypothetical protein
MQQHPSACASGRHSRFRVKPHLEMSSCLVALMVLPVGSWHFLPSNEPAQRKFIPLVTFLSALWSITSMLDCGSAAYPSAWTPSRKREAATRLMNILTNLLVSYSVRLKTRKPPSPVRIWIAETKKQTLPAGVNRKSLKFAKQTCRLGSIGNH